MTNESLLVQNKSHPFRHTKKTERAIELRDGFLCIAEEWKRHAQFPGKALIRRRTVDADAEDLRLGLREEGETILVRLDFVRSGGSVGKNVERQDDILLAEKIAELDRVAILVGKFEIGGCVADAG